MKREILTIALLVLGALVILPDPAVASTNCHATLNTCQGWSQVSTTTGGVASTRCFSWRTTNSAPACPTTTANEASWEIDAGGCINLYYFDTTTGAVPPAVPNKVQQIIYWDADPTSSTAIIVFNNLGAEPANGAANSFCGTSTGIAGGSPRAGTYHMFLRLVKDNGPGGVGNYDIRDAGTATVGTITTFDRGAIRSREIVSSITRSAYPADSTFAYGTAADESVTITSTFTQPGGDTTNSEFGSNGIADAGSFAIYETGATTDLDTTTLAQSFVTDNTYPLASTSVLPFFTVGGNSALTGQTWTMFATTGHGAGITRDTGTVVHSTATFNIDPRIVSDSDGSGTFATADDIAETRLTSSSGTITNLFNRGETAYLALYIMNARGELLSRAMTFDILDASNNNCVSFGSVSPTSNKYSGTHTVPTGGSCAAANTAAGSPRYLKITNTMQSHTTLAYDYVSSLYFIDAHIQLSATLNKDNYPTENANEDTAYIISNAQTDTTHGWCHVVSVRKDLDIDTSGSVITWSYIDPNSVTRLTGTTDTGSDGWTATHLDLLASTPLTNWIFRCTGASFNGNTGTNDQAFTVTVPAAGPTTAAGDPLRITCSPGIAYPGETVLCAISESNLDGSGRAGNTAGTLIDGYDPANTQIVTSGAVTAVQNGIYRYTYTVGATPILGQYLFLVRTTDAAIIASSTAFTVRNAPDALNLTQLDNANMNIDLLHPTGTISDPGLGWWVELTFWVLVFWYIMRNQNLFMLVFALGGVLHLVNPTWFFGLSASLPWLGLGALLDLFIKYRGRKREDGKKKGAMN